MPSHLDFVQDPSEHPLLTLAGEELQGLWFIFLQANMLDETCGWVGEMAWYSVCVGDGVLVCGRAGVWVRKWLLFVLGVRVSGISGTGVWVAGGQLGAKPTKTPQL